jgi:hypothetical protein
MPECEFHIQKAGRNRAVLDWLTVNACVYNEWIVTVMFYVCMHYVDAILSKDKTCSEIESDPQDHRIRNRAVAKNQYLKVKQGKYLELYKRGRDARYNNICFKDFDFMDIKNHLYQPLQDYLYSKAKAICESPK